MAVAHTRHFLSGLRDRASDARRHWMLTRALRELSTLPAGAEPDEGLLRRLAHGWHNEGWSASTAYLRAITRHFNDTRGAVVECGSGLSTLVLGTLAKRDKRQVFALEDHAVWAKRVRDEAEAHALGSVQLTLTGLRSYGEFDWYNVENVTLPEKIGLVICDGPPGMTRGGRYGAVPVLLSVLVPDCVVLLDDTARPEEQQIVRRWCSEFGLETMGDSGTFTALRAGHATGSIQEAGASQ